MNLIEQIKQATAKVINELYNYPIEPEDVLINATKPEFSGDYTVVLFSFIKQLKKSPEQLGSEIGEKLATQFPKLFSGYNVIKGFLNLSIQQQYWISYLNNISNGDQFGEFSKNGQKVMVEYSSPNTNKPLHLGHLRNNFLGYSIAAILEAQGNEVIKTCVVNDRGIHICKSMIAWQLFGEGKTPMTENKKGDHFVGEYYVRFNEEYKRQVKELMLAGKTEPEAEKAAPIMLSTQQMLLDWETGKPEVISLWKEMNGWVYAGFDQTYKEIGSHFDKIYYESETYLLGKDLVEEGLKKKVFFQKEDGSVWIDLTLDGLDEKLVRRKDGTSVYITQDIGLAEQKQKEFGADQSIYVVGDEQNYHFKVLRLICEKLGLKSAEGIFHLSYGMVELPTGKMKSREGTVVDADDLVAKMIEMAMQKTEELGKVKDFSEQDLKKLYHTLGLGALKFFLLRVDPKRKMVFNPEESIDFHGFTGPFIQYVHARICSILRKIDVKESEITSEINYIIAKEEKDIIMHLEQFPAVINESAREHDPSKIAVYIFQLAKLFNVFYAELSITNAELPEQKAFRAKLAESTGKIIKKGMALLGIDVPERM